MYILFAYKKYKMNSFINIRILRYMYSVVYMITNLMLRLSEIGFFFMIGNDETLMPFLFDGNENINSSNAFYVPYLD